MGAGRVGGCRRGAAKTGAALFVVVVAAVDACRQGSQRFRETVDFVRVGNFAFEHDFTFTEMLRLAVAATTVADAAPGRR